MFKVFNSKSGQTSGLTYWPVTRPDPAKIADPVTRDPDTRFTAVLTVLCLESRKTVEHASTVDTAQEAERFLREHPERMDDFRRWVDYVGGHAHTHHVVLRAI